MKASDRTFKYPKVLLSTVITHLRILILENSISGYIYIKPRPMRIVKGKERHC